MHRPVIALCLLVSGWANALTLSPMKVEELVFTDFYVANFRLENTTSGLMYYDVWMTPDTDHIEPEDGYYALGTVLGGKDFKSIRVPVTGIEKDKLKELYVCVQEKPSNAELSVVGRTCAKLRLYWPASELRKLQ